MHYVLSTSWHGITTSRAEELSARAVAMGFESLELGFHLSPELVEGYIAAAKRGRIRIASVHNVCPVPEGFTPGEFFPDHFSLASRDHHERQRAVDLARNTLALARRAEAGVMVLHAGRIEIPDRTPQLRSLAAAGARQSESYQRVLAQMRRERDAAKQPHLDALVQSLEELLPEAARQDVIIALETRYYYRELPGVDEFSQIFERFKGAAHLKYWHDVGHAQVADYLGLATHREYLERYAGIMCGVHLHDVRRSQDHQVPGQGEFDFTLLKPYLRPEHIRVFEVHPPVRDEDIVQARRLWERIDT